MLGGGGGCGCGCGRGIGNIISSAKKQCIKVNKTYTKSAKVSERTFSLSKNPTNQQNLISVHPCTFYSQ